MSLYEQCLELSLDWDSTEDIVHGCVDLVSKEKDAEIERLRAQVKELSEAYQKAIGPIQPAEHKQQVSFEWPTCSPLHNINDQL
jgi:hypothetical protein